MNKALRYEVEAILREVVSGPVHSLALRAAKVLPKMVKRAKPSFRKEKKALKKGARAALVAKVRPVVEARAGGVCECGCGTAFGKLNFFAVAEWDEFYGRAPENVTVEKTWMLARLCHQLKGGNLPTRAHWDGLFEAHCKRHGYPFRPRPTKDLQRSSK